MNNLTKIDYRRLGSTLIVIYVLLLIAFQVVSYFVFSLRYNEYESGMRMYISRLKKIDKLTREEKKEEDNGEER